MEVDPLQRTELDRISAKLVSRFSPPVRPEEVERCVQSCVAMFESARVRTYLALLIERAATDRLRAEVQLIEANEKLRSVAASLEFWPDRFDDLSPFERHAKCAGSKVGDRILDVSTPAQK